MKKHLLLILVFFIAASLCNAQSPTLFGMTSGGNLRGGNIFQINLTGSKFKSDYLFYSQPTEPSASVIQANDGLLYGMTISGGQYNEGTIFSYDTSTGKETDVYDFGGEGDGAQPEGSLIQANNGLLYGMTSSGGSNNYGIIFSYDISSHIETVLHDFGGANDGLIACGSLLQANNGLLYGMTEKGGINDTDFGFAGAGTIFSYNISTNSYTILYNFGSGSDGQQPQGSLFQAGNQLLYGMTTSGGVMDRGIIFSYNITTDKESDLHDFDTGTDGAYPMGTLMQTSDSLLYGITQQGGDNGLGTIFRYNVSTNIETKLVDFGSSTIGTSPMGSLIQASDSLLYGMTNTGSNGNTGTIFSYDISSQKYIDLHNFTPGDGEYPLYGCLLQANNGLLYGMTTRGGINGEGIMFSYNAFTTDYVDVHDFGGSNSGQKPYGSLIKASDGRLYGMTSKGGANNTVGGGDGVILSYNFSTGEETDVHDFGKDSDGTLPQGSLIKVDNGLLYGMTEQGGIIGAGTIFSYDASTGTESVLYNFGSNNNDGGAPSGSLLQANNGLFYGMTMFGGMYGEGTIFNFNVATGTESVLYNFNPDSAEEEPIASLMQADNGLLYGMIDYGGVNLSGRIFSYNISTGIKTNLHDFGAGTDGTLPLGTLLQASNGLLYGMTELGGTNWGSGGGDGTIFSYDISTGIETDLYNFGSGTDGSWPYGSLIQVNDSLLYGMTEYGGVYGDGAVFSYNVNTGNETVIHSFSGFDGDDPTGDLLSVDSTTGINQLSAPNTQLLIYPNPTSGQFTIQYGDNQNGYELEIYNVLGQKVYHSVLAGSQNIINISYNSPGMYFVYLESDENVKVGKVLLTK